MSHYLRDSITLPRALCSPVFKSSQPCLILFNCCYLFFCLSLLAVMPTYKREQSNKTMFAGRKLQDPSNIFLTNLTYSNGPSSDSLLSRLNSHSLTSSFWSTNFADISSTIECLIANYCQNANNGNLSHSPTTIKVPYCF